MSENTIDIILTQENIGVEVSQNSTVSDIDVDIEHKGVTSDFEVVFDMGSGMQMVHHTEDLSGTGVYGNPLGISEIFYNKVKSMTDTVVFEQGEAAATWHIVHNMNKYPSVSVVDSAGTVVECKVTYIDENTCDVYMNFAFKGKAYLN